MSGKENRIQTSRYGIESNSFVALFLGCKVVFPEVSKLNQAVMNKNLEDQIKFSPDERLQKEKNKGIYPLSVVL